jgi:hypothetical protein
MTMRAVPFLLLVFAACQKKADAPKPTFTATCKPDQVLERIECVVENIGKTKARACITAREIPPKGQPFIAQRVCTKALEPAEKITVKPHFENLKGTFQPICSPDGTWLCKDEIVERPEQIGENVLGGK